MKTNGSDVATKTEAAKEKKGTLQGWLSERQFSLESALPKGTVDISRFMQSALLAISNPKMANLIKCSKDSIFRSLKEAASYGLELNGTLGQAYLIPYNEKGVMTCHFQMGYKGLIALARRSNTIKTIAAEAVYENDLFEVQLGVGRTLSHKMDLMKERGEVVGYYCLVELTNGGIQFCVKSKKDIENHRTKFSKAYNPNDPENIWNKNFDAMALKTCVIQALKLCPISIEALEAVNREEKEDTIAKNEDFTVVDYNKPFDKESAEEATIKEPAQIEEKPAVNPLTLKEEKKPAESTNFTENYMSKEDEELAGKAFDALPDSFDGDVF